MSIVCQQPLAINVGAAAYFNCDTIATGMIDQAQGNSMAPANITGWVLQPGLIGNCFQSFFGATGFVQPWPIDLSAGDITIRMWIKTDNLSNASSWLVQIPSFFLSLGDDGTHTHFDIFTGLRMATTPNSQELIVPSTNNVWHRIIGQYNHLTGTTGIIVDNNAIVTQKITIPVPPFQNINNGNTLRITTAGAGGGAQSYIDEIAIFNFLLTPAQLQADYNAGLGTTYPNI